MSATFSKLKTLVLMQLKDKLDLSFAKSKRSLMFKVAAVIGQIVLSGAAFFVFFYLASLLKLFSFSGHVPASLLTAMFTLIFVLAVFACTMGLTNTLYLTSDNRVLLTLPVPSNSVFLSKFILYVIFELKKNATLLLPMYVAYGIVSNAVWYFYPWLIICYVFISLLPVAIGAVLSVPALFIYNFVKKFKWLQIILIIVITGLIGWGFISLIDLLPENINIAGRWGTISGNIQNALGIFAGWVQPLNIINLMVIGGTAEIKSSLFTMNALWGVLMSIGTIVVCTGATYLLARPLFFKMAASQFEFEKTKADAHRIKIHKKSVASFIYELKRSFRSSRYVIRMLISLLLLPIAVFFLNKTYAAMNTRLTGQYMTVAFSLLISLLLVTSDNVSFASVLSVDGNARPIAKTQPIIPQISITARILPRVAVIVVSTTVAVFLWQSVSNLSAIDATMLALIVIFVGFAHLLWCVELDVMHPQHDQYATVGLSIDNPNERNSTILAFLLSALFTLIMYVIMSEGQTKAVVKIAGVALAFLLARVYLYLTRIHLYYAEK